jgi:putative hemolysin
MNPEIVTLNPPGSSEPVYLRHPTFAEWHSLAKAHRELEGKTPPAELIARTLTTCVCDENGKPSWLDAPAVLRMPHALVMWIYARAWDTVLRAGDTDVAELEKNSGAGQD